MRRRFLGANRQVTGSCSVLETGGRHVMINCGLFQEREFLDRNWHVLREGDVWTIRIFSQPYEDSWRRGRPQQLVRNLLCPPRTPCQVHFKDHPPP